MTYINEEIKNVTLGELLDCGAVSRKSPIMSRAVFLSDAYNYKHSRNIEESKKLKRYIDKESSFYLKKDSYEHCLTIICFVEEKTLKPFRLRLNYSYILSGKFYILDEKSYEIEASEVLADKEYIKMNLTSEFKELFEGLFDLVTRANRLKVESIDLSEVHDLYDKALEADNVNINNFKREDNVERIIEESEKIRLQKWQEYLDEAFKYHDYYVDSVCLSRRYDNNTHYFITYADDDKLTISRELSITFDRDGICVGPAFFNSMRVHEIILFTRSYSQALREVRDEFLRQIKQIDNKLRIESKENER